ncbi:YecA family protein [Bradyrhizobium guangdongense]
MVKIGRNAPCPCGSGKKYKRCHGAFDKAPTVVTTPPIFGGPLPDPAAEAIRLVQQGRGRPIISAPVGEHRIVAVGTEVHWSKKWKTFPDFLGDYIKAKLGADWAKRELSKPAEDQHVLMQWAHRIAAYQKQTITRPGDIVSAPMTGVVACFLGTAYALYLLQHNVDLQARLLNRLKDITQFQGAYYELFVASILIRAGFTLTLEDETDGRDKHCEFAAVSGRTGKKYWVEAKMRSVAGLLGRTEADGGADARPLARLIPHLNDALAKPASDDRLIFIDVNTPLGTDPEGRPDWLEPAMRRLERFEARENTTGATALVFVTNFAHHRNLDGPPSLAASPFGLGLMDFNRPGLVRVSDAYRAKKKYIDAHDIGHALQRNLVFPTTFDGKLLSESAGEAGRHVKIGETYFFPGVDGGEILGRVTSATVDEAKREAVISVSNDTQTVLLRAPMDDGQFEEWQLFGEAIFGRASAGSTHAKDEFEMFEWLMEVHKDYPRDKIISGFAASGMDFDRLSDEELRMTFCENIVANLANRR